MKRLTVCLMLALAGSAGAAESGTVRLKLRSHATVYGQTITLADVLQFGTADELADQIGDEPITAQQQSHERYDVTYAQVTRCLGELGVNLARVLVDGALSCEIRIKQSPAAAQAPSDSTLLLRRNAGAQSSQRTLADVLRAQVRAEMAELGGRAELRFDRGGAEFLELTTPPWEFRVSSSATTPLGLREFRVVIRRDGRVQRTTQLYAHVRLEREVVVARRPLSIGNYVRAEDVQLQTRVFDAGEDLGLPTIEAVIGQQVKRFVPVGEMVTTDAIKSVDLVRRSRPVTVIRNTGGVQLRLTGTALDNGDYGDSVRVRLGDTRATRRQLRGVVCGLGTVRLVEDAP